MIKVAINGFGRIGRMVLRALYEGPHKNRIKIVAVNDLASPEANAYLLRHDSTHGHFPGNVSFEDDYLKINGDKILLTSLRDPQQLPWKSLEVDVVFECTGLFTSKEKAKAHLEAGAKKVIISEPGEKDVDATVVFGVNHLSLKPEHTVISNASCTTNCLAPVAKVL